MMEKFMDIWKDMAMPEGSEVFVILFAIIMVFVSAGWMMKPKTRKKGKSKK